MDTLLREASRRRDAEQNPLACLMELSQPICVDNFRHNCYIQSIDSREKVKIDCTTSVQALTGAVPTFARVKLSYKYRLAQNVPSNKKGFQWPKISS